MNTNRSCGCKSFNTCYVCENELGIVKEDAGKLRLAQFVDTYTYCPESETIVIQDGKEDNRSSGKINSITTGNWRTLHMRGLIASTVASASVNLV